MNGYISLGQSMRNRLPLASAHWANNKVPIIAPLWTDIQTDSSVSTSGLRVSQLSKSDNAWNATENAFNIAEGSLR